MGTLYKANDARRDAGFSIFYMGINMGSFIAPLITGLLAKDHGWHLGFGIGGIGMLIALLIFRFMAMPQLQTFNELRQEANSCSKPVVENKNAPKIVFSFLFAVAAVIALTILGIIHINPVAVATYLTVGISIGIIAYFAYLLLFLNLEQHEKFKIIICFVLLTASALFWSAFEQNPQLLLYLRKIIRTVLFSDLKSRLYGLNQSMLFLLLSLLQLQLGYGQN